jgi:hypothetical protein
MRADSRRIPGAALKAALIAAPALLAAAGCATPQAMRHTSQPFDIRSVELCKTTFEQLRARLGEPTRDGVVHKDHVASWITDWESPVKYLAVLLDGKDVVTDLYWNVPTEIPWVPASQCKPRAGA